ncbi:dihydroorotase [Halomicronema sp. CCY15110]|uniref:dihydroorotase n=1 Tax=Halomicronema sp. CCY15110 TaxID=2767773 RepID=UPI00194F4F6C|nr:dihydroorotase [Halomicronema sp. CCY15110]
MAGTLLRQVRVIDPTTGTDQVQDVWMAGGRWSAIAPTLDIDPDDVDVIDGTGKVLAPGLVDLYSHSGEPGNEARETLAELMAGAIAGGFTRVGILPGTQPPLDNPGALRRLVDLACELDQLPQPLLLPWAALTQGAQGEQMTELAELAEIKSFAIAGLADGQPLTNRVLLRRLLEYTRSLNRPLALWPCDRTLAGNGIARDGSLALMGGLPGVLVAAETAALTTILELVRELDTPVHLMRISTARSVALIEQAKADGLPVTASTTWMHLLFSTEDALSYDPNLRLDPPLGNPTDQEALIAGVKTGIIDAIAIDHSPYAYEEKTVAFGDAPPGAIGLQLAFAALWERFVAPGTWTAVELLRALSDRPAQILQLPPPQIAERAAVEAFLFDPAATWTVDASTLRSPARNTPFYQRSLRGQVLQTWHYPGLP